VSIIYESIVSYGNVPYFINDKNKKQFSRPASLTADHSGNIFDVHHIFILLQHVFHIRQRKRFLVDLADTKLLIHITFIVDVQIYRELLSISVTIITNSVSHSLSTYWYCRI